MADVTVKELADVVGTSTERLLSQMKEAGLPQTAENDSVSDEQKQSLLVHLKKSHGEESAAPAPKKTPRTKNQGVVLKKLSTAYPIAEPSPVATNNSVPNRNATPKPPRKPSLLLIF